MIKLTNVVKKWFTKDIVVVVVGDHARHADQYFHLKPPRRMYIVNYCCESTRWFFFFLLIFCFNYLTFFVNKRALINIEIIC